MRTTPNQRTLWGLVVGVQNEIYNRLRNFEADGPLPFVDVHDTGLYVQAAFGQTRSVAFSVFF